jgi:hypothetical protein
MPVLPEFVHASVKASVIPAPVLRWLGSDWEITESKLDDLSAWDKLPTFTWLDFGTINDPRHYAKCWETLGGLQKKSDPLCRIMISGVAPSADLHGRVLRDVFERLNPLGVEVDLAGKPDVLAALVKFEAIRKDATETMKVIRSLRRHRTETETRNAEVPNADIRAESGNLSAKTIAELFGVTLTELGAWIDRKKAALSKTPDAESIQSLLEPLAQIAFYRKVLGDDATFRKWLRTEHELLQQKSPLHWIKEGKAREVAEFVEDALTGQPT